MDTFVLFIRSCLYAVVFAVLCMGGYIVLTDYADWRVAYWNPELQEYEQVRGC